MILDKKHLQVAKILFSNLKFLVKLPIQNYFELVRRKKRVWLIKALELVQSQVDFTGLVDAKGDTLLTYAAQQRGCIDKLIEALIKIGFDPNHVNGQGMNARQ